MSILFNTVTEFIEFSFLSFSYSPNEGAGHRDHGDEGIGLTANAEWNLKYFFLQTHSPPAGYSG
jgi:hypothetical protein